MQFVGVQTWPAKFAKLPSDGQAILKRTIVTESAAFMVSWLVIVGAIPSTWETSLIWLVVLLWTQLLTVVLDFIPLTSWPIVSARMTGLTSSVAGMVHLLGFDAHLTGLLVRGSVVVKADLGVAAEGSRTPSANAIDSKSIYVIS
jgi:hypothetical protein